jgi:site-specific recombinase XerD
MPDMKDKAMCALMYSSGLRIGEVCRLRFEDIDQVNMRVHICQTKARQDRYAPMSKYALDILSRYRVECVRKDGWIFPKQTDPNRPIDTFYLSRHIHAHEDRLGWKRQITCHSFRHAFGTHLYENGVDLYTIKCMLGHKSVESTAIYVHMAATRFSDIENPLDKLMRTNYA